MRCSAAPGAAAPEGEGRSSGAWPLRPEVELLSPRHETPERGTGVVGTVVGFLIIMTLLLFCAQIIVRLYATSTLTAVAARAAEDVAESPDPVTEMPLAVTQARQQLGPFGAIRTRFTWVEVDAQQVVLEVRGNSPTLLPMPGGWDAITRTVTIRTERFR